MAEKLLYVLVGYDDDRVPVIGLRTGGPSPWFPMVKKTEMIINEKDIYSCTG